MLWYDVYLYTGYERDNNYFGSEEFERKQMSIEKKNNLAQRVKVCRVKVPKTL